MPAPMALSFDTSQVDQTGLSRMTCLWDDHLLRLDFQDGSVRYVPGVIEPVEWTGPAPGSPPGYRSGAGLGALAGLWSDDDPDEADA